MPQENVLVDGYGVAKLTDFGLSILLDNAFGDGLRSSYEFRGTLQYADPVLLQDEPRTRNTDMWALGWVIFEVSFVYLVLSFLSTHQLYLVLQLVVGRKPYWNFTSPKKLHHHLLTQEVTIPTEEEYPNLPYAWLLWPILSGCWRRHSKPRLSASEIARKMQLKD